MRCAFLGCNETAVAFDVCPTHKRQTVDAAFKVMVEQKLAPQIRPACFSTDDQWKEYAAVWGLSSVKQVEFCKDCTIGHKKQMMAEGRCSHPETVFVMHRSYKEVIGIPCMTPSRWESAIMGITGPVVSMPAPEVVEATLLKISAPKTRGRPRKK